MAQYEVKHQCDDQETVIPKRTCRLKPKADICERCKMDYVMYKAHYDCRKCDENNKRYELIHVGVGTGEFGEDFALVVIDGEIKKVSLDRVRDIREV